MSLVMTFSIPGYVFHHCRPAIPLVAVFTITYFGTSSKQLTTTFQANVGVVEVFTAVLFTILGLWLGYMLIVKL